MIPLQRKVIIVSLSLSTFLVMGTAYAYSDASTPLQTWFKAQLLRNQHAIDDKLQQEIVTASQDLDASMQESVAHVGVQLEKGTEHAGDMVIRSIDSARQSYADQLQRTASELSESSAKGFDVFVLTSTNQVGIDLEQWADETIQGLTAKLGD